MLQTRRALLSAAGAGLLLSGCGFRLRGHFQAPLKRKIESGSNIRCVKNPNEAEAVLELINQRRDREVLSISDSGRAREYELTLTIEFRVTSTYDDFTYVEPTQLDAQRDIT